MCNRLSLKAKAERLAERYRLEQWEKIKDSPIVYHQSAFDFRTWPVITGTQPDTIQLMHWGFVPSWTKNQDDMLRFRQNNVNARIESIFEKESFKEAGKKRHCLIPATGYFEWQTINRKKFPYYIYLKGEELFSIAGIWETWTDKQSGETKETFSILTTEANPFVAEIHNEKKRMPVILPKETEMDWLKSGFDAATIDAFVKPFDEHKMAAYTIGRIISGKNSDTPEVLRPYAYPEFNQTSLF